MDGLADVDEHLDRYMPSSHEAERAVLGSLLLLPEACDEVALIIRAEDFYDDAHQRIFRHMQALHEDGGRIDPLLLAERLRDSGEFETVGGSSYLLEVGREVSTAAHAEYYARIVHELSLIHI